jgi:putative transposase
MKKGYKFRLYPTEDQEIMFAKTFGCVRVIYNSILDDSQMLYKETGKGDYPQPTKYKKEKVYLCEVDSLALANARINIMRAFNNFFRNVKQGKKEKGYPRFKSKKNPRQSYTTNNQHGTVKIVGETIRLPKVGFVKCKFHRWVEGEIKSATISKSAKGNYYIAILTEQPDKIVVKSEGNKVLGIDMSFQHFGVLSTGEKINPPKWYYQAEKKLSKLSRKVSKCKKGSKNKQKKRVVKAKHEEHTVNVRKDFIHKLSRRLVNEYNVIIVEDINLQHMARHKNWGKTVNNLGFGMFRTFLEYKCTDEGKPFVKTDKYFPSSQLCHICGYRNKATKDLSLREWECPICHTYQDRDINAAKNLVNYYKDQIGMERTEFTPVGDNVRPEMFQATIVESGKVHRIDL